MTIDLKEKLDELAAQYNVPAFIENDPVQFPRRYAKQQDIEIAAFLTATISWGNRASILKSAEKMLGLMGQSPNDFILNKGYERLGKKNVHRTFFEHDLYYLCRGFNHLYTQADSLEELFTQDCCLWKGIELFRKEISIANDLKTSKHISNPGAASACKRLHMALRWLVRRDGIVDIGIWNKISPAALCIPLDTHVARVSRELGILNRKANDRKAVEELTAFLRTLNPEDPAVYDFALFGAGLNRI